MRKSHHSLHGLLRQSLLRSVVCMILPVCVLAGLLVVLTQRALWRGYCIDDPCLRGAHCAGAGPAG